MDPQKTAHPHTARTDQKSFPGKKGAAPRPAPRQKKADPKNTSPRRQLSLEVIPRRHPDCICNHSLIADQKKKNGLHVILCDGMVFGVRSFLFNGHTSLCSSPVLSGNSSVAKSVGDLVAGSPYHVVLHRERPLPHCLPAHSFRRRPTGRASCWSVLSPGLFRHWSPATCQTATAATLFPRAHCCDGSLRRTCRATSLRSPLCFSSLQTHLQVVVRRDDRFVVGRALVQRRVRVAAVWSSGPSVIR